MNRPRALLMSGGIGDYLHYLCKLPHFLEATGPDAEGLTVFVESTVPHQVASLFEAAFPRLRFAFTPAAIHWTKTNPLLVPDRQVERVARPAYRYVVEQGFGEVVDWFLPLYCGEWELDPGPLERIVAGRRPAGNYVAVSLRDKGFRWWPTARVCRALRAAIPPQERVLFLGTPVERVEGLDECITTDDVAEALALSHGAELFVGTDTGLATIRELTDRKNIYCIDEFWLRELMMRYGYLDEHRLRTTPSRFAFGEAALLELVAEHFAGPAAASPAFPILLAQEHR